MPETNIPYIGVDIAKPNFVADLSGTTESFEQSPRDFAKFIKRLPPGACVVCEATGGYEQALVECLCAAGIAVAVVMPKRVRFYAKSLGLLAKSDPIDARLLSRYARANPQALRLCRPRSKSLDELRELLRGRDELIELIKTETNRAEHPAGMSLLAKQAAARKRLFEKQLAQIETAIEQVLASDQSLRERAERLRQIQGIGKVSAWTVLAELPELGSLDKGQPA